MALISIDIPFEPVPWAAPKIGRGYAYDIREKDKRAFRQIIKQQYTETPLAVPVCIFFVFNFAIPRSFSKKKRQSALEHEIYPTRCDCTNLQKLYEDCLKGIVIEDDRHVFAISSMKFYAEKPSVAIRVFYDT